LFGIFGLFGALRPSAPQSGLFIADLEASGPKDTQPRRLGMVINPFGAVWRSDGTLFGFARQDDGTPALRPIKLTSGGQTPVQGLPRSQAKVSRRRKDGAPNGASYCTHSVTCAATSGGIVSPSACAVFTFTANSTVVSCSIGRSAGRAPRRILSI
jgi:hypothetical protein